MSYHSDKTNDDLKKAMCAAQKELNTLRTTTQQSAGYDSDDDVASRTGMLALKLASFRSDDGIAAAAVAAYRAALRTTTAAVVVRE